jgi:2-polyprenyl-6-methoxyphenol hydroxylase-like FAD-dependent oxidoreductase
VDQLRAARLMPPGYPIGEITAYGSLSSEFWHAPPGRETVREFYSQANERLPQYVMETVLRAKMAELPCVEARFGWTATKVEQDAGGARVTIAQEGGAKFEVLQADYVVGCDGAHSLVREQAGIARGGTDFDQPWCCSFSARASSTSGSAAFRRARPIA